MAVSAAPTRHITRDDLEAKFRELEGEAREQVASARTTVITAGGIAVFLILLLVFLLGRRAGKQRSTVVEIRRV
jgi:shikimate kinase